MIIFLTWLGLSDHFIFHFLLKNAVDFSAELQMQCASLSPQALHFKEIQRSLFCGTPLPPGILKTSLQQQSLIHLFVVSGGHFLLIEKILTFFRAPQFIQIPGLIFYNFVTGFQAPGTRSVTQMILTRLTKNSRFSLRSDQLQWLTGLILLSLFPLWSASISLLLSWTAALGLEISTGVIKESNGVKKKLKIQLLISLLLFPWLWVWGQGHPLVVLSNLIFGPLIVAILFPLSGVVIVCPFLSSFFDITVKILEWLLVHASEVFPQNPSEKISLSFFWFYLFALHLLFHWSQLNRWRTST